ncbi:MAG TPA: type II toxin-antitoxin system VapC family toxin [Solirubrobacteraceae bacterium]|nr:type II toxin-antitoxin system VapC family toxin [Solirubrobacteraceae bacterium]
MSRCYLDTNFLYVHLRSERSEAPQPLEDWRSRVLAQVAVDGGVISALVFDELAYRLILAWLRDDGVEDPLSKYRADAQAVMGTVRRRLTGTWRAVDSLSLELQLTDRAVVERARSLMMQPGLGPRDSFHAAHALVGGCEAIASTDAAFDHVSGLRRLAP